MLSNPTNNQFIANKTSSRAGVICSNPSLMTGGGPYGVSNNSLNADVNAGLGKARASVLNHPSKCDSQKGGSAGHDYDADAVGQTYGYTKAGAAIAGEVRGGYAPITITPKTNMCGGKKKRRRKNKSRKSRRKSKKGKRRRKTKRSRRKRKKSRRKSKSRKNRKRRTRRRMKGGRYQQYGSNVPNTPSYSGPYTAGPMPWATGPVGINRQINC